MPETPRIRASENEQALRRRSLQIRYLVDPSVADTAMYKNLDFGGVEGFWDALVQLVRAEDAGGCKEFEIPLEATTMIETREETTDRAGTSRCVSVRAYHFASV